MKQKLNSKTSKLLDTTAAASYCGVSARSFDTWRCRGVGPVFVKVGRCVRYRVSDLDAYIEARLRSDTSARI